MERSSDHLERARRPCAARRLGRGGELEHERELVLGLDGDQVEVEVGGDVHGAAPFERSPMESS